MAQAYACRLSPMLEVSNVRADMAHRYPTTQGTWTAQTTLSNILWHSATVLHLLLSPASGLKPQDAASGDPAICAHHIGPGKRKRQPALAARMRQGPQ